MTGYSSSINGENQTKLKEKSQVFHGKDVVFHGEDVFHGEAVVRRDEQEAD